MGFCRGPLQPRGEVSYLAVILLRSTKLHVPRTRIERLVAEQTPVTPDTALRLARFFETTPQFWMNMQSGYDIAVAAKSKMADLEKIEPLKEDNYAEARLAG